jgi:condensin complex subunit 1
MSDPAAFNLQDELQCLADPAQYQFDHEQDLSQSNPRALLLDILPSLSSDPDSITDPIIFDTFRSILKHADVVPGPVMSTLLDSLLEGLTAVVDRVLRDEEGYLAGDRESGMEDKRAPLERYAFLLQWFVSAAEKVKGSSAGSLPTDDADASPVAAKVRKGRKTGGGGVTTNATRTPAAKKKEAWSWIDQIPALLTVICKTLRIKTHRIWTTSPERDVFITYVPPPSLTNARVLTPLPDA